MSKTTIQISSATLERLKSIKKYERQSYDEVLNSVIDEVEEEALSPDEIKDIQQGLEDIKKGRIHSIQSVAKELGISLN